MLDKLAASPEPKVKHGPTAMCYSVMMPEEKSFDYLCKKCGTRTHYPENYEGLESQLAFYRDSAVKLRGMGLDIKLDESALCRHCASLKDLGIPTAGVIVAEPRRTPDNKCLHSLEPSERFMELHREEKREEGDRGDQEEKRGNQKERHRRPPCE